MRLMNHRAVDALTIAHKLLGVAWFVGAAGALWLGFPLIGAPTAVTAGGTWVSILIFERVATVSYSATLAVAVAYGLFTPWGFIRHRAVLAKWVIYLVATVFGGYSITVAKAHSATAVVILAGAEVFLLIWSTVIGVFLAKSRRAGEIVDWPAEKKSAPGQGVA